MHFYIFFVAFCATLCVLQDNVEVNGEQFSGGYFADKRQNNNRQNRQFYNPFAFNYNQPFGGAVPYNNFNNYGKFDPTSTENQQLRSNINNNPNAPQLSQPNSAPPFYYPNQISHPSFPNFNLFPFLPFGQIPYPQGQNNGESIQGQSPNQNHQQDRLQPNQPQPIPTSADGQIASNQINKKENATLNGHFTNEDEMIWQAPKTEKKILNLNCTLPTSDLKP